MDQPNNNPPEEAPREGWILYDGDCSLCSGPAGRFAPPLIRRGFSLTPLQTPWVAQRLGLKPGEIPDEMKLLTAKGVVFGGHQALLQIARRTWWGWIFHVLFRLPGMDAAGAHCYRWMADRRHMLYK